MFGLLVRLLLKLRFMIKFGQISFSLLICWGHNFSMVVIGSVHVFLRLLICLVISPFFERKAGLPLFTSCHHFSLYYIWKSLIYFIVEEGASKFAQLERKQWEKEVTFPPENALQEQIRWTKEGRLWKFPIDNEQGESPGYYQGLLLAMRSSSGSLKH